MRLTQTHTIAEMEVSAKAFDEIKAQLEAAEYDHAILDGGALLDMSGIGLTRAKMTLVCVNGHDRCAGGPFEGCPYCEEKI